MKFSQFNVWTDRRDGVLILFNSMTGALATFEKPHIEIMKESLKTKKVSLVSNEFLKDLITDGYIIDDSVNELQKINNLVTKRMCWKDEYFFSVILNLDCNFDCFYCFESLTGEYLQMAAIRKLLLMFSRVSKEARKISVDWYGGEPLLSFDLLCRLNDKFIEMCQEHKTEYEISITTNGYLLNKPVIEYLKNVPLTHLQITVDGPPETHNVSRPLKNGDPTFDVILNNIELAVKHGLHVVMRVNIMTSNADKIIELYQIVENRGLKNKIQLMLKPVVSSSANPCEEQCLSGRKLAKKMTTAYKWAAENGWVVFPNVDSMQCMGFCVADFPHQFIIDLQSNLYKCGELFIPKEVVGKIDENGEFILNKKKYNGFVEKNPLNFTECRKCSILPICMGGCNMKRYWKKINCCEELKYDLPNFVEILLLNQFNINQTERRDEP